MAHAARQPIGAASVGAAAHTADRRSGTGPPLFAAPYLMLPEYALHETAAYVTHALAAMASISEVPIRDALRALCM